MSEADFGSAAAGLWPGAPVYDAARPGDAALEAMAWRAILEIKAQGAAPLDDLQAMLNGMTRELRGQLEQFERLRVLADEKMMASGEEIDRKLIQADAKASIEAMSAIVRTLEKIDALQRTIAHDRRQAAETAFDEEGYRAFAARCDARIEARARLITNERERARDARAAGAGEVGELCPAGNDPGGCGGRPGPPGQTGGEGG